MIRLPELAAAAGAGAIVLHPGPQRFRSVAHDSRNVVGGELFLALRGPGGDGHVHLADAVRRGAAGLVVDREPPPACPLTTARGEPVAVLQVRDPMGALRSWAAHRLRTPGRRVVGIAGSLGKSTAQAVLRHALGASDPGAGWFAGGDRNDAVGIPIAVAAAPTSARAFLLELAASSAAEHRALARLTAPDVVGVTTTREAAARYWRTESQAVRQLRLLAGPGARVVVPADEPRLLAALSDRDRVTWTATIGANGGGPRLPSAPDVTVTGVPRRPAPGWTCTIAIRGGRRWTAEVPLAGPGGLRAVGLAVATLVALGLDPGPAVDALPSVRPLPGRLRHLDVAGGPVIIDDTVDATPASTLAALAELRLARPPRVAVLGECAGRRLGSADVRRLAEAVAPLEGLVLHRPSGWAESLREVLARRAPGLEVRTAETIRGAADAARRLAAAAGDGPGAGGRGPAPRRRPTILVKAIAARAPERLTAALGAPAGQLVRQDPGHRLRPFRSPRRPTWIGVDLDALAANVRDVVRELGPQVALMAVVKADAYGHGGVQVARTAVDAGATWVATATVGEALELRRSGLDAPCLVLGYTPSDQVETAVRARCSVTALDLEVLRALDLAGRRLGRPADAHLEVDTGMSRLGIAPAAVPAFVAAARALPGVALTGCYTHLSRGEDRSASREQLLRFDAALALATAAGHRFELVHTASSAAWRHLPSARRQMVRLGLELLGLTTPDGRRRRPVLSFRTRVAQLRTIPAGTFVGYGTAFAAPGPMRIATIPVGFGDGFRRGPRTWGTVLVGGAEAPIVGDVCMDLTMVDVTRVEGVDVGDEVVLIGRQGAGVLSCETVAARLGTTTYELCAQLLPRVPREVPEAP